jgi:hypothetical protein
MGHGAAGGDDRSGCTTRLRKKPSQSFERVPALPQRFGPGLWVQMTYPSHQSIPMIDCTRPLTLLTRCKTTIQLACPSHAFHTTHSLDLKL